MNPLTIAELRAAINGLSTEERNGVLHLLASIAICNETVHEQLSAAIETVSLDRAAQSLRAHDGGLL